MKIIVPSSRGVGVMIKKAIAMHGNFSLLSSAWQARLPCRKLQQHKCASLSTDHCHGLEIRQPCSTETKAGHN